MGDRKQNNQQVQPIVEEPSIPTKSEISKLFDKKYNQDKKLSTRMKDVEILAHKFLSDLADYLNPYTDAKVQSYILSTGQDANDNIKSLTQRLEHFRIFIVAIKNQDKDISYPERKYIDAILNACNDMFSKNGQKFPTRQMYLNVIILYILHILTSNLDFICKFTRESERIQPSKTFNITFKASSFTELSRKQPGLFFEANEIRLAQYRLICEIYISWALKECFSFLPLEKKNEIVQNFENTFKLRFCKYSGWDKGDEILDDYKKYESYAKEISTSQAPKIRRMLPKSRKKKSRRSRRVRSKSKRQKRY